MADEDLGGPLVTLDEAKRHLYQDWTTDNDSAITEKLAQASAVIRNYLKARNDATWTEATVPLPIKSAVLVLLAHQWEDRGDDSSRDEDVWNAISRLVVRYRDPAFA